MIEAPRHAQLARGQESALNAQICAAVREQRLNLGVLQAQLAAHLGLAESTFSRYESGQRTMSAAMLCMIADYLRQPITTFLPNQGTAAATPPTALSEPVRHIAAILQHHPETIPAVIGLLETLLEEPDATAAPTDE